mgnify:CR=1 FL=1
MKIMVLGEEPFCTVFKKIQTTHFPEASFVACKNGGFLGEREAWDKDPLDTFIEEEPTHVVISYHAHQETRSTWHRAWKEIVEAHLPGQKIYRASFFCLQDIQWVAEGNVVRKRNPGEELADYIRLPLKMEEFRQFFI